MVKDTGIFDDTGSIEEFTCSHYLPIQVKAIVDGKPVFAAVFEVGIAK